MQTVVWMQPEPNPGLTDTLPVERSISQHAFPSLTSPDRFAWEQVDPSSETLQLHPGDLQRLVDEPYQMYFTSGTTSMPKAATLTHKIVCSHALGTIHEMRFHQDDVWLHG